MGERGTLDKLLFHLAKSNGAWLTFSSHRRSKEKEVLHPSLIRESSKKNYIEWYFLKINVDGLSFQLPCTSPPVKGKRGRVPVPTQGKGTLHLGNMVNLFLTGKSKGPAMGYIVGNEIRLIRHPIFLRKETLECCYKRCKENLFQINDVATPSHCDQLRLFHKQLSSFKASELCVCPIGDVVDIIQKNRLLFPVDSFWVVS